MRGVLFSLLVVLFGSSGAWASPEKEFVMSCTYGVVAGTLVGAATLAFEDRPGDNLNNVARGASLGLYAGIVLGLYTVYYLPGQLEKREQEALSGSNAGVKFFPVALSDGAGVGLSFRF
jgi:hypothetical protein